MEKNKMVETQHKTLIQVGKVEPESKALSPLPQNRQSSAIDLRKTTTPDRLKLPNPFKYPERYTSPTDSVMSPISKGFLRNRRGGCVLFPKHQIRDLLIQDSSI